MSKTGPNPVGELVVEFMAGSHTAFEKLVSLYEGRLYSFFYSRLNNVEDARELTQDVFITVFQKINQYDPGRPFEPWLFTIARNTCINHTRKKKLASVSLEKVGDASYSKTESLLHGDDCRYLWQVAEKNMPELQFSALWLSCHEGMSIKEVAESLGRSPLHVKVLLYRARKKLFSLVSKDALRSGELLSSIPNPTVN